MSCNDQGNPPEASELCQDVNPETEPELCACEGTQFSGINPLAVYSLTLDAILRAQQQLLCPQLLGITQAASTCRVPSFCPAGFQGRYTVRPGDTMFFIAQRCGVSLQSLINANPHISNPNQIFPCDVLCVPPRCADLCRVPATCPPGFQGRYSVRPGDTMFFIAQRCGVSLQALINANPHITNPNQIFPCDVLCVPPRCANTCRIPATCPPGFQGRYTVRPGDTMFFIAQRCGVSLQALINANPHITNPNQIFPCDVLCVPLQCASRLVSEEDAVE